MPNNHLLYEIWTVIPWSATGGLSPFPTNTLTASLVTLSTVKKMKAGPGG